MVVEIRLYKVHDTDLIALAMAGYSIPELMRDAICAYANGNPLHYYIDEPVNIDFGQMKGYRSRFTIPNDDKKAVYMLKNIKHKCRNMFCKTILRDALVQQNILTFFASDAMEYLSPLVGINAANRNVLAFKNTIPLSSLKKEARQVTFNGLTATAKSAEVNPFATQEKVSAFMNLNPQVNMMPQPLQPGPQIPSKTVQETPTLPPIIPPKTEGLSDEQLSFIEKTSKEMTYKEVVPKEDSVGTSEEPIAKADDPSSGMSEEDKEAADKLMRLMDDF